MHPQGHGPRSAAASPGPSWRRSQPPRGRAIPTTPPPQTAGKSVRCRSAAPSVSTCAPPSALKLSINYAQSLQSASRGRGDNLAECPWVAAAGGRRVVGQVLPALVPHRCRLQTCTSVTQTPAAQEVTLRSVPSVSACVPPSARCPAPRVDRATGPAPTPPTGPASSDCDCPHSLDFLKNGESWGFAGSALLRSCGVSAAYLRPCCGTQSSAS